MIININKDITSLSNEIWEKNEIINKIKLDYDTYIYAFEVK